MANRVVIDVVTRYKDEASKALDAVGKSADKTKKKLEDTAGAAAKLGRQKPKLTLDADDRASSKIVKAMDKARSFASKTYKSTVDFVDKATGTIGKVTGAAKSFAGKTFKATVGIVDNATAPLRTIKNALFSVKTLVAGVVAGAAVKQGILNPIGLADAYSGAKAGFTNILGSEEKGQEMMDKLDAFAKESPFDGAGVISNAQKMISMGWNFTDADSFIDDMRILGNAAASTGNMNQGLESIVRAMSQIKTKGKLSTEELNQLAEAGIPAKALLAEAMGYGSDDAGIAAMTQKLEKGAIGSQEAIDALMKGMKRFDGMMDSMANETAEGLMAQLKDAFEINIFRRWGQGLQEGAKQGLGSVIELLDKSEDKLAKVGDVLFDLGSKLSVKAAEGLDKVIQKILTITESDAFTNAGAGDKAKMLWDEIIAKPMSDWWESSGREKVVGIATEIGSALAEGMMKAFMVVAKENPLLALLIGTHAANSLLSPVGGIGGAIKGITSLPKLIGSTGNYMMQGTGLLSMLANAGYALTGGSATAGGFFGASTAMSGGTAALLGGAGILGGIGGLLGINSGVKSLLNGNYWGGGAKLGMVGTGAAIGAVAGGPLGALLGAGVGGVGAMLGGDKIGELLKWMKDETVRGFDELGTAWTDMWDAFHVFVNGKMEGLYEFMAPIEEKINTFFNKTMPDFFSNLWSTLGSFFSESLPSFASSIWSGIKSFFTDKLPGWATSVLNSLSFGGGSEGTVNPGNNAAGGFIGGRTLSWLGEEGPEAVIPLGAKHRNRAIGLLNQAGQALGVDGGGGVHVEMGGVHIHVSGSGNVAGDIEAQKEEIAEQVAAIFNRVLKAQFENMPARGGA